ncbi:WSC domain-containing protein 1 isoform X1 [Electrophorus electricus]|uniref:WSC domain-containing protein 1 isoform X1 n=1 Tax=Electrophorus electricus TaxID=8005 RepID=UPI0015D0529D|nr:WSC domain-containing protein 1 isoform X1 [Electrophorus electricus]
MAKTFYRLQRFLRRAHLLLLFLGVAYIMAGSVLLLQRSSVALFQRGTDTPSLLTPPRTLEVPGVSWHYRRPGSRIIQDLENNPLDLSGHRAEGERFMSRNLKLRHLRQRGFQGWRTERDDTVERNETRHKGTYMGCFVNDDKQRALGGTMLYDFRKMTSSLCQDTCSESGYQFAGLEYGTECHCGNRISAPRARTEDCNLDCRGERGSPCGGVARLSVYKVEEVLPGHRRYRNVHYHGCFLTPTNTSDDSLLQASHYNLTSQLCVEACTDKELPLALMRGWDCLCGPASSLLIMHKKVEGDLCGWSNTTNHSPPVDQDYFQVYSTPVLESRCRERTFLPERSSSIVALSSFPGAGNTWLRHLIELTTGYYTGSYYFDGSLYSKGFKGEKDYWRSGRTICVKTHESGPREIGMFDSAILLIRNPYRCLVAEFNRKCAGHLGHASDAHWKSNEWPEFVDSYASWWASHALAWLKYSRRLLVLHYEELREDLRPRLKLVAAFLNASVSEGRLLCAASNRDGHFKRSAALRLADDPFTLDMRTRIDGYVRAVNRALRDRNLSGLPEEYMPRL